MPLIPTSSLLLSVAARQRRLMRVERGAWYRDQWLRAAATTGWAVEREVGPYIELRRAGENRLVSGPDAGLDRHVNFRLAGSSTLSAEAFALAGVPTPRTWSRSITEVRALCAEVQRRPGELVIKPAADTGGGRGVTVAPRTRADAVRAVRDVAASTRRVVVQEVIAGDVVRVLVVDGRVADAVVRTPATVVGDATSTVRQLIDNENGRRVDLGALATGFIPVGADARVAIARSGLSLGDVPEAGLSVQVSGCSNTGSEHESRRIKVTPASEEISCRAARAVGVRVAGVDLVVDNAGAPLVVLEVNGAPGLHWHALVANDPFDPFAVLLHRPTDHAE